ncbi:MAG: tRNA (adenosine(37)-N6)-threonylcarbamoyltransferase complex dimerization subunit type 1 TsaB [Psychroflexus sp.]|jgi:tRNA threonylcarbamoyladenosine biosynthesis protein TsaB|nr:tRNA (adenosine(37)-N6)-threonylcarbamoyltransferase complex dimerization subunit type 1 TsaB [Psychroflexus sp.]
MSKLLHIETATTTCSVAVSDNEHCLAMVEQNNSGYSHAEQLQGFIHQALKQAHLSMNQLDAVAVSEGPGSYTGLRIGVATAKGLCYALDLPLIKVSTLENLARQISNFELIIPLIDARRNEVYASVFDHEYNEIKSPHTEILTYNSFEEYCNNKQVIFIGNAVDKWQSISESRYEYSDAMPSAKDMIKSAYHAYYQKQFVDIAYFEPYYLKDFIAGPPKAQ